MSVEIKIPAVGESISSGVLSQWHKQDGESVESGDLLLTLDTDKISTEITAEVSGVLKISAKEGDEVEVGSVVGSIEKGAAAPATKEPAPEEPEKEAPPQKSETSDAPEPPAVKTQEPASEPPHPAAPAPAPAPAPASKASELAEPTTPAPAPDTSDRFTRKRMSPLRRKIATHLVNAQQNAAILTTFNECDMSQVMAVRKQIQETFVERHGVKLGFMSFFLKATVEALKAVPQVNSRVDGEDIVTNHFYDIGVAVGTERGLVVPVIRDCDKKSFADIEKEIAGYAKKAREGKIEYEDLEGGGFTITNGGIYGSMLSTPILNPPQSGILGMHNIQDRPVARDGQVVIRPMMYLALSYDHRIVDGKEAVTFLIRVKECIEQPTRLLLEA